jgi:uncharacterized protein (DUF1800 family)
MDERLRAQRLLARASFGARPEDGEAIRKEGPEAWVARELSPVPRSDAALAIRLERFPALGDDESAFLGDDEPLARGSAGRSDEALRKLAKIHARSLGTAAQVVGARIVRAVHSNLAIREVMVDFWSNHFSVDARKGIVGGLLPHYQREVLDRHALGRFEDLLVAVAKSPAMLFYLDNWSSTATGGSPRRAARRRRGTNENYARELLELHTLGIDGAYTQRDVIETARALTGWSLERRSRPVYRFHAFLHDTGEKTVLGESLAGDGEAEGEGLLRRLARHPSTARHVSRKLATRFVCDSPPDALVERAAHRFLETEGEIASVVSLVLLSPEFADPANRKLKTPLRLYASALREAQGETEGDEETIFSLARLGEVPFFARTPAGHPETSARWINPGAMLERIRIGHSLGAGNPELALRFASPEFQWC